MEWPSTSIHIQGDLECAKAQIAMLILLVIAAVWYIFMLIVTIKYYKTYRTENKWVFFFFIMLNLTIILRIVLFITTFLALRQRCRLISRWTFGIIAYSGNLFFWWGVVLNLFNWLHLIMIFNQYLSYVKKRIDLTTLRIWWAVAAFIVCLCFIFDVVIIWESSRDNFHTIDKITRSIRAVVFLTLSTAFIIVGWKLDSRFK